MRFVFVGVAVIGMVVASASTGHADWIHHRDEDPFTGDRHLAFGADDSSGYALGFRCTRPTDLTMIFVTPERMDMSGRELAAMSSLGLRLMVIVDDQPKVELPALAEAAVQDRKLTAGSTDPKAVEIAVAIAGARRRVAVAMGMLGQVMHSRSFDVRGSRRAIEALLTGCKIGR